MTSINVSAIIAVVVAAAVAFSSGWVLRDAAARGMPPRRALSCAALQWAALQWVEFPLFLWLYRRIRPKTNQANDKSETDPVADPRAIPSVP